MSPSLQLILEPGLDGVARDDDIALRDSRILVRLLRDKGFDSVRAEESPGTKGGDLLVPIIQIVVSGGGLAGLFTIIDSWLKNRGGRNLVIRRKDDGSSITIRSSNLSEAGIAEVIRALSDPPPAPSTPVEPTDLREEEERNQDGRAG